MWMEEKQKMDDDEKQINTEIEKEVEKQEVNVEDMEAPEFELGGARLMKKDQAEFKALFARFEDCDKNCWTEEKQAYAGAVGVITTVYDDKTVTMMFDDGKQFDFPFEAIEKNVKISFVADQ